MRIFYAWPWRLAQDLVRLDVGSECSFGTARAKRHSSGRLGRHLIKVGEVARKKYGIKG
jgi:hypothetical protein